MAFCQIFEKDSSSNIHRVNDSASGEAGLIDPLVEMLERDLRLLAELCRTYAKGRAYAKAWAAPPKQLQEVVPAKRR